jgi:hypothetical protein
MLSKLRTEYTEAVAMAKTELATNSFVGIIVGKLHLKNVFALEIPMKPSNCRCY